MQTAALQPIQQKERTAIVDILRGWALLGVVLMNYVDHYFLGLDFRSFQPSKFEGYLMTFGDIVFSAKSWTMLSFLFGYGFTVLLNNLKAKGTSTTPFFLRRMFWLLMLAVVNSAFFFGDILKDYAVMGALLLLLINFKPRVTFILSLFFILLAPAVGAYINILRMPGGFALMQGDFPLFESHNPLKVLWFGLLGTYKFEFLSPHYLVTVHFTMMGCFLLGVSACKIDFFNKLKEYKKQLKWIFWLTLAATLLLKGLFYLTFEKGWTWWRYYSAFSFPNLTSMIFIGSAICWLYVAGKLKAFFANLQIIGRMTLTNYMTQNVLGMLLFSGFGFGFALSGRIHFGYYMLFGLSIYIIQVYFSKWWLKHYKYGPIEWVWRQLSYAKRLPIKREEEPVEEVVIQPVL